MFFFSSNCFSRSFHRQWHIKNDEAEPLISQISNIPQLYCRWCCCCSRLKTLSQCSHVHEPMTQESARAHVSLHADKLKCGLPQSANAPWQSPCVTRRKINAALAERDLVFFSGEDLLARTCYYWQQYSRVHTQTHAHTHTHTHTQTHTISVG